MAYDDPRIKKLYLLDKLIGSVYDTHNGLGWTTGKFKLETNDKIIIAFLNDYETLSDIWGEDADEWDKEIHILADKYGPHFTYEKNWKLVIEESGQEITLELIPFIDNEINLITMRIDNNA